MSTTSKIIRKQEIVECEVLKFDCQKNCGKCGVMIYRDFC